MLTWPMFYQNNKYDIEESHDMDKYTLDQLYGSLFAFEIAKLDVLQKEKKYVSFKDSQKIEDEPK